MKKSIIILVLGIAWLFTSCDNNSKVNNSKKESNQEANEVEQEKAFYKKSIDSLSKDISSLSRKKNNHLQNVTFANAEIHNLLKSSFLDHVIIGTKHLENSKNFYGNILGFKIKNGKKHKNGISNFFIEFEDSSEIEFMAIENPTDKISIEYSNQIDKNNFGLIYAIRTKRIDDLLKYFSTAQSDFTEHTKNKIYSTISKESIDPKLPVFFIQYANANYNSLTKHKNKAKGLSAIWLSTNNIRKSINQYSDLGFSLVDTLTVANIKNKTALIKNDNFDIIFIESNNYGITGVTIKTDNIEVTKTILNKNLNQETRTIKNKRGESIYLSPQITNSIWIEFLED